MTLADLLAAVIFAGVALYALLGGADYGAGVWDLLAGSGTQGAARRHQIDRSLGPVWETNHVWLIFVLVYLWTAFPRAFVQLATTLYLPLALAGVGIVYRGAAFAFRKVSASFGEARWFGVLFAGSSVVTPFFLGTVAGAVASGRVPAEGTGDLWAWVNPTSLFGGVLAVGTCAWSAAVLLASDAERDGRPELAGWFAGAGWWTGIVVGALSLVGVVVIELDAPTLAGRLQTRAAPAIALSALTGVAALALLRTRQYGRARVPALVAVGAVVAGWGVAQYPWLLVDELRIADRPAPQTTLVALLVAFAGAAVLAVPSLVWLLRLTARGALSGLEEPTSSDRTLHGGGAVPGADRGPG